MLLERGLFDLAHDLRAGHALVGHRGQLFFALAGIERVGAQLFEDLLAALVVRGLELLDRILLVALFGLAALAFQLPVGHGGQLFVALATVERVGFELVENLLAATLPPVGGALDRGLVGGRTAVLGWLRIAVQIATAGALAFGHILGPQEPADRIAAASGHRAAHASGYLAQRALQSRAAGQRARARDGRARDRLQAVRHGLAADQLEQAVAGVRVAYLPNVHAQGLQAPQIQDRQCDGGERQGEHAADRIAVAVQHVEHDQAGADEQAAQRCDDAQHDAGRAHGEHAFDGVDDRLLPLVGRDRVEEQAQIDASARVDGRHRVSE